MKLNNKLLSELGVSGVLVVLLILLLNPFHLWMPQPVHMTMLVVFAVLFILFGAFIFMEKASDEREVFHLNVASRYAYLAGSSILVIGVIVQSLHHELDMWLVLGLGVMILTKITGLIYTEMKN